MGFLYGCSWTPDEGQLWSLWIKNRLFMNIQIWMCLVFICLCRYGFTDHCFFLGEHPASHSIGCTLTPVAGRTIPVFQCRSVGLVWVTSMQAFDSHQYQQKWVLLMLSSVSWDHFWVRWSVFLACFCFFVCVFAIILSKNHIIFYFFNCFSGHFSNTIQYTAPQGSFSLKKRKSVTSINLFYYFSLNKGFALLCSF